MQPPKLHSLIYILFIFFILFALIFTAPSPAYAAGITVEPLTWNIIGLDSNKPAEGPNHFPVGARVCNDTGGPISNVKAYFKWDSTTNSTYIYERPGTATSVTMFAPPDPALANGDCADVYFEVEVLRDSAAYNKTRRYHIEVSSTETGSAVYSTPTPRELFVEHLVSQSRNAVTDVQYGISPASLASVPAGGTMSLVVGQTYYIKLVGFTATQGYNQLESFINFPNTIFQVLSVESVYSAPSAGYSIDKMYSDACGWDNVISSPTYRSCIVSDNKTGGNIAVTYQVKILSVPGGAFTNPEPLSTLIYDFSGSSYHYNANFGISTRYAYVLDPAAVNISKSFLPSPIAPGGTSTLTFTLKNTAPVTVTGVSFGDHLPSLSDGVTTGQMVADPATYSASGCGTAATMSFSPVSNPTSLSFSGGTIAPNGSCTVSLSVSIPDVPTSGDYPNISENAFVGSLDTGHNASANLTVDASTVTTGSSVCGQKLVEWIMDPSQGILANPPKYWPATKAPDVDGTTTEASYGNAIVTGITDVSTDGDPANSWWGSGFAKTGTPDPDSSPYFQFRVDTTNYTDVKINFRVKVDTSWASSATVYVHSSTTGLPGSFSPTPIGSHANLMPATYTTPVGTPWAALQTGSQSTYFRIFLIGANNASSKAFLDNIVFTGCGPAQSPRLTKIFNTNPVVVGGTSTLTFHIYNPNSGSLAGVNFTDVLPDGLVISNGSTATVSCDAGSGSGTLTTTAPDTITFTNGVIPANTTCRVTTPAVTANTPGPHANVSGFISSTESGTNTDPDGSAKASLVAVLSPTIEKTFDPSTILANETSTLTFVLTNPNPSDALPNVAFSDGLPPGMILASDVTSSQCGGTVTGITGAGVIGFSGGTILAGDDCEVIVEVTASNLGDYVNTSDPVTTTIAGLTSGVDTATATLSVETPNPAISILKRVSTSPTGPWSTFLTVAPGTNVYYQFTVENTGDVDLDNVSVSDSTLTDLGLDLSSCAWASLPRYSDAVTCVTASTPALDGNNPNTATARGTYIVGGTTETAISSASYVGVAAGVLNLSKQISTSPFGPWSSSLVDVAPGSTVYYRFTIVNATGELLTLIDVTDVDPAVDLSVCSFTDPLPNNGATTCVVPATVSSTSVVKHINTATAHGTDAASNVIDSSPSSADYTPTSPDLTVSKSNDTGGLGVIGVPFTWTITVTNSGTGTATFMDGQTIISDPLPAGATYGLLLIGGGIFGPIDCAINSGTLTCTPNGAAVTIPSGGSINVVFDVTPTMTGVLANIATVDPGTHITESDEGNNEGSDTVTVLAPPTIVKTFLENPIAAGNSSTLRFTITNPNASQGLSGVAFSDTLPLGMTLVTDVTTPQCGGAVTGTAGGNTVALSGGIVAASSSCTVDVLVTVAAGGNYLNTSGSVTSTNGNTGNTATATLNVFQVAKEIVSTSEASTGFRDSFERVAVGEIIRYRLTTTLPEGTWSNFQIVDAIDTGIQFLNDGTAVVSFICDSACTSSPVAITPGSFSSSTDPTFDLGIVENPDTDPDAEYLVIEFNALVLNMASNAAGGLTRNNSYTVSISGIPVTSSPNVGVRIAEPSITNLTKAVSPAAGPYYPGDTISYTLTYSNGSTGVNRATAFDVFVTDSLNANLDLQSVSVTAPASSTATDTSTLGVAGVVRVLVDQVPPSVDIGSGPAGVTITVIARIVSTAPSGIVPNTASLTYTSLPGGATTGDSNGTCPNPTGSCTPPTSISQPSIGERNGTGGAPNTYNDMSTVDITVDAVPIDAVDDDYSSTPINGNTGGNAGNAFTNDTLNAVPVDPAEITATVTTPASDPGVSLNTITGSVDIAAGTPAGTYLIDYQICENLNPANCDTATVTVTVVQINRPPVATDNASSVDAATPSHTANMVTDNEGHGADSDPDNDPLTVTQVDGETNPLNNLTGKYGTLDWAADGSYTYTIDMGNPEFLALAGGVTDTEIFPYIISDGKGGTATANIIVTITGADDVPVANDDSFTTPEDTPFSGDLKPDNGTGADIPSGDGGNIWSVVTGPLHGIVTVHPDGTFTYMPDADYNGSDSFTYRICDLDNDCDQATVILTITSVEDPAIGIAKRAANITRVGSGIFEVTLELYLGNFGDSVLSNVQVTEDLSVTFPAPSTFMVQSVTISGLTNAALTANLAYNGRSDTNLLSLSGSVLAVNGSGTVTVVVHVLPSSAGPFYNSAFAIGETPTGANVTDESSDGTDSDNTANCPACVNRDGDPTNNTKATEINFDPNIFDPPFGFKELDASGLPVLRWTMIWINDNNFPSAAAVSDPIPAGTAYEATGAPSGYALPAGAPTGSSNLGLSCLTDNAAEPAPGDAETTTTLCYYEGPTGTYPRGRIVWEGLLGPDLGATDQADANDELYITFSVRVANGVTTVQNRATIDADLNNDADMTDPGEQIVATARAAWQEPAITPEGREDKRLPGTGFAPGKVSVLSDQSAEQVYTDLGDLWLEIPSLGLKTPIVGVPKNAGVWDVDWLWDQAGWLHGTAFPTWQGNSVLTAHVYLPNGNPGPFVDLNKLRFGNQAIVHAFSQRYIYEIRTNHIILPTNMSPFKHEEKAWLTLLTCKGYDESTDTYKYRVAVRAVLVKVEAER